MSLSFLQSSKRVFGSLHATITNAVKALCDHTVEGLIRQRVVRAAIIGSPNAGKTTLVNQLLGQKVFAVSQKVHTTNRMTLGVFNDEDTQVVLLDTPGVVPYRYARKLKLSKAFMTDPHRALSGVDLAVVIMDASDKRTRQRLDPNILQVLRSNPTVPSILVLNKVDLVKHKHVLLMTAAALVEEHCTSKTSSKEQNDKLQFEKVFMISSLENDGVDDVRSYLVSCGRPGQWEYSVEEVTDQPVLHLVEDIVREKLLQFLHKEIPYTVTQENLVWEEREDGVISIFQALNCKSSSQASIVIGPGGKTIQDITEEAKKDIEALLDCQIDLTLHVRTRSK